jgi:hypothetical protein
MAKKSKLILKLMALVQKKFAPEEESIFCCFAPPPHYQSEVGSHIIGSFLIPTVEAVTRFY